MKEVSSKGFKFKEVKELPQYQREPYRYTQLINDFLKSGVGIADITEYLSKNKIKDNEGNVKYLSPNISTVDGTIRHLGFKHKLFVTTRSKKAYIVNIEVSGIKYTRRFGDRKVGKGKEE